MESRPRSSAEAVVSAGGMGGSSVMGEAKMRALKGSARVGLDPGPLTREDRLSLGSADVARCSVRDRGRPHEGGCRSRRRSWSAEIPTTQAGCSALFSQGGKTVRKRHLV